SPVEDDVDVIVAGGPGIDEQLGGALLEVRHYLVAQPVQRLAQRRAPPLVPARRAAGMTAAVAAPPLDTMCAAPRRVLLDLDFPARRVHGEERGVVRERRELSLLDVMQCIGKRHLAVRMMMSIRLAIGRDVREARLV